VVFHTAGQPRVGKLPRFAERSVPHKVSRAEQGDGDRLPVADTADATSRANQAKRQHEPLHQAQTGFDCALTESARCRATVCD